MTATVKAKIAATSGSRLRPPFLKKCSRKNAKAKKLKQRFEQKSNDKITSNNIDYVDNDFVCVGGRANNNI